MNKYARLALAGFAAMMFSTSPLYAQFFSADPTPKAKPSALSGVENGTAKTGGQNAVDAGNAQAPADARPAPAGQNSAITPFDYGKREFVEEKAKNAPPRQVVSFGKDTDKKEQELIMMFMKDFKVYRSPSGQTRCSMQFAVITTLKNRLSNISYRLQWPKMDTVLSFNDVAPQVENHYNYSLLGDGCYSMDKTPNIVINRCRVKGMTQQTCASKVRWITRKQ